LPHLRKSYLACVYGDFPAYAEARFPIAHHASKANRMTALPYSGAVPHKSAAGPARGRPRPASSDFVLLKSFGDFSAVSVRCTSALMHQVRVHAAALGHPIVGDKIYRHKDLEDSGDNFGFTRHALHAWRIRIVRPGSENPATLLELEAPLPEDFRRAF